MSSTTIYGIKNCDSVKKARRWLESHQQPFQFVDYRAEPLNEVQLKDWIKRVGIDKLLNKRSTSWKNLPESVRLQLDDSNATDLLQQQPTLIKRPVLVYKQQLVVGFDEQRYLDIYNQQRE